MAISDQSKVRDKQNVRLTIDTRKTRINKLPGFKVSTTQRLACMSIHSTGKKGTMNQSMHNRIGLSLLALILSCGAVVAQQPTTVPTTTKTVDLNGGPADVPAAKVESKTPTKFMQMHDSFLKRAKAGPIGVLFLGDSITEGWGGRGKEVWNKTYAQYQPANFGIGGDRTQHVLWRIDNGELDGINPKVLVLMIGTNNIGYTAEEIAKADVKICSEIHEKLPNTKLLLLGIFPRGMDPKDAKVASMRDKIKAVNAELAKLDDGSKTRYLDIGDKFLTPDGMLTKEIMPDALHPNAKGYQIWADAMQPLLDEVMK
jgi:lysophospholipase L1-like esterase